MALNNSSSKQQFGFAKSSRFPTLKSNTVNISSSVYNKPSDFNRTKNFGDTQHAFGSRANRFDHCNVIKKSGVMPSPLSYSTNPRTFSPDVSRSNGWSVGFGRDIM